MLVDLALVSCSFDDQYVGYSTVQNAVYSVDYGHLNSLDLARESKTFMDSVVRALEFNSVALLLTVKPASPILT